MTSSDWSATEQALLFDPIPDYAPTPEETGGPGLSGCSAGLAATYSVEDIREVFLAWVATLVQPLVSTPHRTGLETRLLAFARHSPEVMSSLMAGFMSGLVQALCDIDPWANLSVRWDLSALGSPRGSLVLDRTGTGHPSHATMTAAYLPTGDRFGLARHGMDLVAPLTLEATETDPETVTLLVGLTPIQSALVGLAADRSLLRAALEDLWDTLTARTAGMSTHAAARTWWMCLEPAVRWLVWRHQSFRTSDHDMLLIVLGSHWVEIVADLMDRGVPVPLDPNQPVTGSKITRRTFHAATGGTPDPDNHLR